MGCKRKTSANIIEILDFCIQENCAARYTTMSRWGWHTSIFWYVCTYWYWPCQLRNEDNHFIGLTCIPHQIWFEPSFWFSCSCNRVQMVRSVPASTAHCSTKKLKNVELNRWSCEYIKNWKKKTINFTNRTSLKWFSTSDIKNRKIFKTIS